MLDWLHAPPNGAHRLRFVQQNPSVLTLTLLFALHQSVLASRLDCPLARVEKMSSVQFRLFVVCGLVGLINIVLFCACGIALARVLRAAARDAYSSPRRRLLALDDGAVRRMPGTVMAMLAAFRPFTTQKALLSMLTLSAARECCAVVWRGVFGSPGSA